MAIRPKEESIETLRGVAILLVVAAHVVGTTGDSGMRVEGDSVYRHAYFSLSFLRLPLFTVISGYVYSLRPVRPGFVGAFLTGKVRRIILPLLCVASLQYLARCALPCARTPCDIGGIWSVFVYSFDQFWFLQAVFLAFLTVTAIDRLSGMGRIEHWLLWLAAAVTVGWITPPVPYFAFSGYLYLLPYFILGCGLRRFASTLGHPLVVAPMAAALVCGIVVQQLVWYGILSVSVERFSPLALTVGVSGLLVLFRFRWVTRWLARIGFFAYAIFLFHQFFASGIRVVLDALGVGNREIHFVAGMAAGIFFSILVERLLTPTRYLRTLLLGLRPLRSRADAIGPLLPEPAGSLREAEPSPWAAGGLWAADARARTPRPTEKTVPNGATRDPAAEGSSRG